MFTNAKTIIWLVCLCSVSVVSVLAFNSYDQQPTPSNYENCKSGSIEACVKEDKSNKTKYLWTHLLKDNFDMIYQMKLQKIADENKKVKEQASKLFEWSSFQ